MPARAVTARSRDLESEATRRAILDATEHLLATVGEEGLSIREVCARAGVTPPTIYHHFGDKAALVDRVVDECFADFDRAFARRAAPTDPVEALHWAFDHYVEYGREHPAHYRMLFQRAARSTPGGVASYDRLRRRMTAIHAAGRLRTPIEEATAACWAAVHGVTSLLVNHFWQPDNPAIARVRDAIIAELTAPAAARPPARARRRPRERT